MNTKLYVGNLSFNTTQQSLQSAFSPHGSVAEVALITEKETGNSRGFGFVTMSTPEEAQAAVAAMHGADLDGRALTVNEARPREERASGSGGGYRGGSNRRY